MTGETFTVLGISGSFRQGSFNSRLMNRAAALFPPGVKLDVYPDISALPHFTQDCEGNRTPEAVSDFRQRIDYADAVLVATPEYNGSMPGVLKNSLDWASRPSGESVLAGKPAAVIGASPGRFGAIRAQADVRKVLTAIGADVVDHDLPIARAHEAFAGDGSLLDPGSESGLSVHFSLLIEAAGGVEASAQTESANYSRKCQLLVS